MELPWLISLLLFFLTVLTLLKFSKSQKNASQNSRLPPGPPKFPFIGNLHQLAAKNSPHHCLAELAEVYGPIMHLRVGEVPTVIVSSADVAREALKTHDAALCSRPSIAMMEHIFYGRNDIAFAPYGEYWRQIRKIATVELFTAKRVQSFQPIREDEVALLVNSIAMEEGSVVNLSKKLFGLAWPLTSPQAYEEPIQDGQCSITRPNEVMRNIIEALILKGLHSSRKILVNLKKRRLSTCPSDSKLFFLP